MYSKLYAEDRSYRRRWNEVTGDEICGLRANTANGYGAETYPKFCLYKDAFVETPIFPQTMIHSRFELGTRFIYFGDKITADAHTAKKFSKFIHYCNC